MMPKLDGIEVCRRLRARSQVPIIMLTAKDDEVDKVLGLEMGADDYITKPFSVREFRSRVRAALRRSEMRGGASARTSRSPPASSRSTSSAASVDRSATSQVRLTYVEFEILAALAPAPGRVMTRENLLEHVWGDSAYRDPRTIDVHIRHLREKLERDPRQPEYLFTVRGVGYRFRDPRMTRARAHDSSVRNRLLLLFFAITTAAVVVRLPLRRAAARLEPDRREARAGSSRQRRAAPAHRRRDARGRPQAELRRVIRSVGPAGRRAGDGARGPRPVGPAPEFVVGDSELERDRHRSPPTRRRGGGRERRGDELAVERVDGVRIGADLDRRRSRRASRAG